MAEELNPRQIQILKATIEEYTETAEAVGSEVLEKKYNLGISPATIRNEMVALTRAGFLKQPHTSAGRLPTPKSIKFYIGQLMEEKELSVADEVAAKERVMSAKNDFDELMQEATRALAEKTHALSVAATEEGHLWHAGYANILDIPEFYNIDVTARVLSLLDEAKRLHELFFEKVVWQDPVEVLFGEELGWTNFEPVGIVVCRFRAPGTRGTLGVVGASRFNYPMVIPTVRYFADLISQISAGSK